MAWELQQHMHGQIRPALEHHLAEHGEDRAEEYVRLRTYQLTEGVSDLEEIRSVEQRLEADDIEDLNAMVEHVIGVGTTTTGGREFYIDVEGWATVAWVTP